MKETGDRRIQMDMEKEEEKESRLDIPELDLLEAELEREQY